MAYDKVLWHSSPVVGNCYHEGVHHTHQMYTCIVQSKTSILIICCTMDIVFHSICACPLQSVHKVDCSEYNFVSHSFALQNGRGTYMQWLLIRLVPNYLVLNWIH